MPVTEEGGTQCRQFLLNAIPSNSSWHAHLCLLGFAPVEDLAQFKVTIGRRS